MSTLRPGITLQHTREKAADDTLVRSDITGVIGVIPKARWPPGARTGDFIEVPLTNTQDLVESPMRDLFDPVSLQAVDKFFRNGGAKCHLFGLCIKSPKQLISRDPFRALFFSLMDRLRGQEDLGLLIMPVLAYLPTRVEPDGTVVVAAEATLELLLDHCREMNNRFVIIDAPKDLHEHELLSWVKDFRKRYAEQACYGAVYYPWLMNGDNTFPPSGAVAGVYARVEREAAPFGVRNPPANEVVRAVTHPSVPLRWTETENFLGAHINLLITSPARGVLVWGARTLSSKPQWRHINSRRIVSLLAEQLRRDNEWVIFENQRPQLWDIVRRTVSGRLAQAWSAGLLTGDRAGSDYLVQCDKELNTPEVVDAGQVHVRVQVRPITTTEYVVVDLRLGD